MRLLAIIIGSVAAVVIAVVLTVPWWLGVALAGIGPRFGLQVERYERIGYSRFRLEQATFARAPVEVHVSRVEADTPVLWLWRRMTGGIGPVRAGDWSVKVTERRSTSPSTTPRGWVPLRARLERVAEGLSTWLPDAQTGAGRVEWPNGALTFGPVVWQGRTLACPDVGYRALHAAVDVAVPAAQPWRAVARAEQLGATATMQSVGATLEGDVTWLDQRAPISVQFPATGWAPEKARLVAENWNLPAEKIRLGQHYDRVSGDARVEWGGGQWVANVAFRSEPRTKSPAPPLAIEARGHGNTREFVAETLQVSLPGAQAQLRAPVAIGRDGRLHTEGSAFSFALKLENLPWFEGRGHVTGEGSVRPDDAGFARIEFAGQGEDLAIGGTTWRGFAARGQMTWPELEIAEAHAVAANGDELRGRGGWNFRARELKDASASGRISRESLGRWQPEHLVFDTLDLDVHAAGPARDLTHEGHATITGLRASKLRPLRAELRWQGRGEQLEAFTAEAQAGTTTISAGGSADLQQVRLSELRWREGSEERLSLAHPAVFTWRPILRLEPFQWTGPAAAVKAEFTRGDSAGQLAASLRGLKSQWLRDLVDLPAPDWTVDGLEVSARWKDGPAEFAAAGAVTLPLGEGRSAQISARLQGDEEKLEVTSLRIGEGESEIVNVSARLPVVVQPAAQPLVKVDTDAAFTVNAMTTPNPRLWEQLAQLIGVQIIEPEARAQLSGSFAQPRGEVRFRAQRLAPIAGRFPWRWPKIEGVDFHLTGEEHGVRLDRLQLAVEDQAVQAQGWLPFEAADWRELVREPARFMQRGEFRLSIPDADVAVAAQYFPTYLAPKGRASLEVTLNGTQGLRGFVRLRDAMLRPLGPLGVVQEINADVRLEGRSAVVENVTGRIGGQLVTLRGRAELPPRGPPQFDFSLRGENLPFVRQAGLLVRGDLDLTLTTPPSGPPQIGGTVRLRDSLFLSDVRALIPSGTKSAGGRPPYFAIETPPLNAWRLSVRVEGERFLRLRTPVFNGTATARFQLGGTLGEPRATGEALIDEGAIRLPFASFDVRQGQVRLTAEQLQPQIWVTAATRRYGYDLRMEITGPVTSPNLTFSSSPPLESEQVLLLVMAGQPPNNEVATTDRQRAARFGAFFGQSLLGSLSGDPEGVERLTITSGENVSEQGRETYNIEYRLNPRWSLTGEYDEFDDYYGGIKWRFYQKGGEETDEK
ncbi:translocation/assembly module TamB domain-containing protein [Opitutus terrae]|uniref:Translocation and assembly module TamB C-terminal domain-containing protein n=1 Tax=Opitutus terrae (strain DSM 11246 / JCM 15787 / PB90-1) TaxID=452637 RepID=B1ZVA1_OPITP|nr:translocation/assembly module TamB domain-containing protein [Opitutus terrae]ACB76768.1 protein of unknown function DUF490 [Opitutus terrae PB90-1]